MAIPLLFWFAEYSNVTSFGIVVVCFLAMTIFLGLIIRMSENSGARVPLGVQQQNMVRMENPFFLQLVKTNEKLEAGLSAQLSTLCPCIVWVLWGPRIQPLHNLLLTPGWGIRKQCFLEEAPFPELEVLHYNKLEFRTPGDHSLVLPCPEMCTAAALGSMPRQRYPAAVFVFLPQSEEEEAERVSSEESADEVEDSTANSSHIIGLVSIVHLKDEVVMQSSHVIGQYIKTYGVPIYSLQPLYLSDAEDHFRQARRQTEEEEEATGVGSSQCAGSNTELNPEGSLLDAETRTSSRSTGSREQTISASPRARCSVPVKSSVLPCEYCKCSEGETNCERFSEGYSEACREEAVDEMCPVPPSSTAGDGDTAMSLRKRNLTTESCSERGTNDQNRNASRQDDVHQLPDCVVCQSRRVRCVLLPCRHACVCHGCFKLLDKCPMCRGAVHSYFFLEDTEEEEEEDEEREEEILEELHQRAVVDGMAQLWNRWNLQLNAWLGFH